MPRFRRPHHGLRLPHLEPCARYTVYYGDTLSKRSAALTEALVIGAFLVIAIVLVVVMVPGLMRGEAWARICLVAVAGGLVVYPLHPDGPGAVRPALRRRSQNPVHRPGVVRRRDGDRSAPLASANAFFRR